MSPGSDEQNHSECGFTLVELLAAVAVMAMLIVVIFTVQGNVRQKAQAASCLGNLRQLAAGSLMYSVDNGNEAVPICTRETADNGGFKYSTWRAYIAPYCDTQTNSADSIFRCTGDEKMYEKDVRLSGNGVTPASYGINMSSKIHDYLSNSYNQTLSGVVNPASTIFIAEIAKVINPSDAPASWVDSGGTGNYGYARFPNRSGFYGSDSWDIFPRHGGSNLNVVFYDGHAASVDIVKDIIDAPPGTEECIYDNQ